MRTGKIDNYIIAILLLGLFTSCISHYEFSTKNIYNKDIIYTLSIKKDRYTFLKQDYVYINRNYGCLSHIEGNIYALKEFPCSDSIFYPFNYLNKKDISDGFVIEISRDVPFNKIIVNDTLYLDTIIKPVINRKDFFLFLKKRPLSIQLESNYFQDFIFLKDSSKITSKIYRLPDTCNYMKFFDNPYRADHLGVNNIRFNKKTGELFTNTNKLFLKKVYRPIDKTTRKSNRIILKELKVIIPACTDF